MPFGLFVLINCLVGLQEACVLRVFDALGDVKGQGQGFEGVFGLELYVALEVVEKCLFVSDVVVFLQVVVHAKALGFLNFGDFLLLVHPDPALVSALADLGLRFGIFEQMVPPDLVIDPPKQLPIAVQLAWTLRCRAVYSRLLGVDPLNDEVLRKHGVFLRTEE